LGTFAFHSSGRMNPLVMSACDAVAYTMSLITWLGYAAARSCSREEPSNLLTSQRWNQSLAEIQTPAADGSLIPMFEGMVDRAFSRTPGQSFMTTYALEKPALGGGFKIGPSSGMAHASGVFPAALSTKF
jgi:hypothetical protein